MFRLDTVYEGIPDNGPFNRSVLDAAETRNKDFFGTERFLMSERLGTGFAATYVFLREVEGEATPQVTIKHYCGENIIDFELGDDGELEFILFRESDSKSKRFENSDEECFTFRELSIEDGFFVERIWTCLLYTSPSPRDQRGSRMPSSA